MVTMEIITMKNFLNKSVVLALALAFTFSNAKAELPNEMELKTEVGSVVLTIEACPIKANPYDLRAYATEKLADSSIKIHKGCWGKTGPQVNILFYEEPNQPFIATYSEIYFKPKPNI